MQRNVPEFRISKLFGQMTAVGRSALPGSILPSIERLIGARLYSVATCLRFRAAFYGGI